MKENYILPICLFLTVIFITGFVIVSDNQELKSKLSQCTNQLKAAEGIIEAFKREGR